MSEIDDINFEDLTRSQGESSDPDYLSWKEAKIKKAREDYKNNPDASISHAEMRKRFKIEH